MLFRRPVRAALLALGVLGAAWTGGALHAHHAISGTYDESNHLTIEGVVRQFRFTHPHPFLVMEVRDPRGKAQRWTLEMDNRWELEQLGFATETLKPGDHLVVDGNPARRLPQVMYLRRLERPADGFRYQHHP